MQKELIDLLDCPFCRKNAGLKFVNPVFKDNSIVNGNISCELCGRKYGMRSGIPVFFEGYEDEHIRTKHVANWKFGTIFRPFILGDKEEVPAGYTLDIGCGEKPRGDVNVDICIPEKVPDNFVLADAENLPFKDKSFDVIRSSYVIEHCIEPAKFIMAMCRIARKEVRIITDNGEWFGIVLFRLFRTGFLFHDEHCYLWTDTYMRNLIRRLNLSANVRLFNSSRNILTMVSSLPGMIPLLANWSLNSIETRIKMPC